MSYDNTRCTVAGLVAAIALSACTSEPATRKIMLMPAVTLPAGSVTVDTTALNVHFVQVEGLMAGHHYVAWASAATGFEALGELTHGEELAVPLADLGLPLADIDAVIVTIEDEGGALPSSPTGIAVMSGEVPGPLTIAGIDDHSFEDAMADAVLEENSIEVAAMGLPLLPSPLVYGVWGHFPAAHEEEEGGHTDAHALAGDHGGDDDAMAGMEMEDDLEKVFFGNLDPQGALAFDSERFLVTAMKVTITIEAKMGMTMMSSAQVLAGEAELPEGSSGEESGAHMH